MKTPEEIKKALECCGKGNRCKNHCPFDGADNGIHECTSRLSRETLYYISLLEEQISLMKIQMRGDCGVCRHRDSTGEPCASCMMGAGSRPNWEYEGLPELARKENK